MKNKNKKYDAVVIGAGNGGLVAATRMAKKNMKVLLLEKHNIPGGFATSFVRGRFEFEPSLHELGALGDDKNEGCVLKIFKDLGINIKWHKVPEAFTLVFPDNKGGIKKYHFPFGRENFAKAMESYFPGTYNETIRFIDVCKQLYDCVMYLTEKKGNVPPEEIKSKFPDFLTTGSYTLWQVLEKFKLPLEAKHILAGYWSYLGLAPNKIAFTLYGIMFAEYIFFDAYVPENRTNEISSAFLTKFMEYGGDVWLNTAATKIDVKDGKIVGVHTTSGYIETEYVVSNISPTIIYGEMIDKKEVPKYDKKLVNYRRLNMQGYCIYLGLDTTAEKLGLNDYSYFICSDIDQNKCAESINTIEGNNEFIVTILNNVVPDASEKGTCIMSFTTLYDNAWEEVNESNYYKTKEEIAKRFIKIFEEKMNINIKDHIEEIEIATPVTFARYTGTKNGTIYGYYEDVKDGPIVRSKLQDKEINIKGLRFAGGYSFRSHGYSTTYVSGDIAGLKTFSEWKKGLSDEK